MSYKAKNNISSGSRPVLKRKGTVLVLEDDLLTRTAICEALRHEGFVVLEAYTSFRAVEVLKHQHVDVLFADLNLPSDDEGLLAALYAQVRQPGVKVILTSSRRRDRDDFMQDYFGPFISKPYLLSKVVRMIGDYVKKRAAAPSICSHPNHLPPMLWD